MENSFKNIMQLACLDTESDNSTHLAEEINAIMDFVEQLRKVPTANVAPLFHPFDLHQRFRNDVITAEDCRNQLAEIAPLFEDGLYLVPKVIDSGQ